MSTMRFDKEYRQELDLLPTRIEKSYYPTVRSEFARGLVPLAIQMSTDLSCRILFRKN